MNVSTLPAASSLASGPAPIAETLSHLVETFGFGGVILATGNGRAVVSAGLAGSLASLAREVHATCETPTRRDRVAFVSEQVCAYRLHTDDGPLYFVAEGGHFATRDAVLLRALIRIHQELRTATPLRTVRSRVIRGRAATPGSVWAVRAC